MPAPKKKLKLPATIDTGWATVIAAFFALLAVILPLWLNRGAPGSTPSAPSAVAAITATTQPSATVPAPSVAPNMTPTTQAEPPATVTAVASTAATAIPQVVSLLPKEQQAIVQKASEALLQAGQGLTLIVKDDFENNDYNWFTGDNIFTGGIECNNTIKDSTFQVTIHSANGPAYCTTGFPKVAKDFIFTSEQQLINNRNADIYLYYRFSDDGKSYYYTVYNPQTQLLSVGLTKNGQAFPIINPLYIADINKNALNKLTLLVLGSSHAVYINDKLVAMFNDNQLAQGQFRFTLQLHEANQDETLLVDHIEIRGN